MDADGGEIHSKKETMLYERGENIYEPNERTAIQTAP